MSGELLFERGERAVEIVGSVGHVELGILQVREQVGTIRIERTIRRAYLLVRVVPLLFPRDERVDCFLLDVLAPRRVPRFERRRERRLVGFGECQSQRPEFFPGLRLGTAREVLRDLFDLMELAYLDRNVFEYTQESAPAVHDSRKERPALLFENAASVSVVRHALALHIVPPDILLEIVRTEHADTVVMPPEGGVGDEDRRLRLDLLACDNYMVELIAYPDMRAIMRLGKLRERLFSIDVLTPQ